jgi:hypothetical protein
MRAHVALREVRCTVVLPIVGTIPRAIASCAIIASGTKSLTLA